MSLVIAFHRAASAEFIAASAWYENKRQGLALAFMAEIDHCVSQAAELPLQYAIVHQLVRRIRRKAIRHFCVDHTAQCASLIAALLLTSDQLTTSQ